MKNFLIKLAVTLWVVWWLMLVSSCVTSSPAKRYARTHQHREFTSIEKIGKKLDKAESSKPKEHKRRNKY